MLGVMYATPVPREAPPVNAAYQFIVPAEDVAPNVTVPVPHLEFGVVPVMDGTPVTVIVAAAAETVHGELLIVHVTT